MEILQQFREDRKRLKIKQSVLIITEEELQEEYREPTFSERRYLYKIYRYNRKYHLGEIYNRILCQEQNKPSKEEIEKVRSTLNNNLSLDNIYKNTSYNQRKHLIFIYLTLNNLELPKYTVEINNMKEVVLFHLIKFFRITGKRGIEYRLIIDVICKHFRYEIISSLLYYKNNHKHVQFVQSILFPPG